MSKATKSGFWDALFRSGDGPSFYLEFREISKHGRPFLLLPTQSAAATATLSLYPAQSFRARIARSALQLLVRICPPIGADRISLAISANDKFVKFLAAQTGSVAEIPMFGTLAGNPAHDTQRFIIVVFDQNEQPVAVVKAGLTEPAKALIDKERQFLSSVPANTIGIPKLRSSFRDERVNAFAMNFVEGDSPRSDDEQQLPIVLASWISSTHRISLHQTYGWSQLEKNAAALQGNSFFPKLRDKKIQATLQHGDFVPWNIKVSTTGTWTVLDWERGDFRGIPGWDWFHYITQAAILVGHKAVAEIAQDLERLLASEAFKIYSKQAGIADFERELVIAYLTHLIEVIKPAEGFEGNRALLALLLNRWFQSSAM